MQIVKQTFNSIIKAVNPINSCILCGRSERNLMGTQINSKKNIQIFCTEELCIDCEIKKYPERFHGCGFCKRPIRERFSCTICSEGFVEWVKTSMHPMDTLSEFVRRSASDLVNRSIYDLYDLDNSQFIMREDDGYYKWPGFYAGITNKFSRTTYNSSSIDKNEDDISINKNEDDISTNYKHFNISKEIFFDVSDIKIAAVNKENKSALLQNADSFIPVWIVPRMTKQFKFSLTDLKFDIKIFQNLLIEILQNNNINLYYHIQIDPEIINFDQIVKINTYDTRVIKHSKES